MRPLLVALALLTIATILPTPAAAQQQGSLVITIAAPEGPLRPGETLVVEGYATLTVDVTGMLSLTGIPVHYTAIAPAWANAIVSPASDVFPTPPAPTAGLSYSVTRAFMVTIGAGEGPTHDVVEALQIQAQTAPSSFGQSFMGIGATALAWDAPDETCDELHGEELLALAREAADEYAAAKEGQTDLATDAPRDDAASGELHVQTGGASPLALPWIAVAGFALVGAGVGLVLRRRLGN